MTTDKHEPWDDDKRRFVREVVQEAVPAVMEAHVNACPWGKRVTKFTWIGVGILICLSILGISTAPQLFALLTAAQATQAVVPVPQPTTQTAKP